MLTAERSGRGNSRGARGSSRERNFLCRVIHIRDTFTGCAPRRTTITRGPCALAGPGATPQIAATVSALLADRRPSHRSREHGVAAVSPACSPTGWAAHEPAHSLSVSGLYKTELPGTLTSRPTCVGTREALGAWPSQDEAVGFADSAARRYSALMRRASSSWSSRITMRQAASMGVPWSTSSRARAAMRSW